MYTNLPDGQGFSRVNLDLQELYQGIVGYDRFKERFPPFMQADPLAKEIISLKGDTLTYRTEHIHVEEKDKRKSVLFLLGNPAVHSVATGIPFSYQHGVNGGQVEHRFWSALRETGFIDLPFHLSLKEKRKILFEADYDSKIVFNLDLFFTLPSTASGSAIHNHPIQKLSGVAQIQSLLGKKALSRIFDEEKRRLDSVIQKYDVVIACQKNAYDGVRSSCTPSYEKRSLMKNYYETETYNGVKLFCVPPTYLFRSKIVKGQLATIRDMVVR